MVNKVYQNQKCILKYSKKKIDKAARLIRHGCAGSERDGAILAIQNFREAHLYPLMLIKNHLVRTSNKVSKKTIVARRLKRLPTIIDKLERPTLDGMGVNAIKLTRMQDIGGCRAIVKDLAELLALKSRLEQSKSVHRIIDIDEYLKPKATGYGGVHLIYSCFHNAEEGHDYKKRKIEVQLRTEMQHAWATSLEIIDTLKGFELKTSTKGNDDWREFFRLAGDLVAHEEGACKMPAIELGNTIINLVKLNGELDVVRLITGYSTTLQITGSKNFPKTRSPQGLFLVTMQNSTSKTTKASQKIVEVSATHYPQSMTEEALDGLSRAEADEDIFMAILASSSDIKALKKAYPNYFGATNKFTKFISKYVEQVRASWVEYEEKGESSHSVVDALLGLIKK